MSGFVRNGGLVNAEHFHYVFPQSSGDGLNDARRLDLHSAVAVIKHTHPLTVDETVAEDPQAHYHFLKTGGPYFGDVHHTENPLPVLELDGTGWDAEYRWRKAKVGE
jgi:hypothetical protein